MDSNKSNKTNCIYISNVNDNNNKPFIGGYIDKYY